MQRPTILAGLLAAIFALGTAAAAGGKVKYVPPKGFNGHVWGELRTQFESLPKEPIGVGAAWIGAQPKDISWTCVPPSAPGPGMGGSVEACDFYATLQRLQRSFEGGGFYVLSEYTIPDQGFRMGDESNGVVLYPIVYQFCANWRETKKAVPPGFDAMNKFCGVRLVFQSETREELAKLPSSHVTVYDKMLELLLKKYGKPDRFARRGQVVIETEDGETADQKERKFSIWRWCPARDRGFHTSCEASVVLTIDPKTGTGMVLYSTPLLWEYAFARENNGFKGDRLFRILHARKPRPSPAD